MLNKSTEISAAGRLDARAGAKAALIFLIVSALYFLSRSAGLDEIDSVNFAMGVREFNVWNHQPHPPGYPLYIALGKIGVSVFGVTPEFSLYLVAALGGGLFIAIWFLIIRLQFNERLAWWVAICLAVMPVVWMTATKVLTDMLAAGFASAEILAALYFVQRRRPGQLFAASLFGAAAAGARPQLILLVVAILVIALIRRRASAKLWIGAGAVLIAGCLLWLLPMWHVQSRLRPDVPEWLVYPRLVYTQWVWRFDKPSVYIGAGDWSAQYIGLRLATHFLGWLALGFGFLVSTPVLIAGCVVTACGLILYLFRPRDNEDKQFWRFHRGWALVHIVTIFVCLPATQRYYLLIFPLLLVALLRGYLRLPAPWNLAASALPALLLFICIPLAIQNHREPAPPIRLVHYLEELYPPSMRNHVILLFSTATNRHVQWYAPDFITMRHPTKPLSAEALPELTKDAVAAYTDNVRLPLPRGWYRIPLIAFARPGVIYWKGHFVELYLIQRGTR